MSTRNIHQDQRGRGRGGRSRGGGGRGGQRRGGGEHRHQDRRDLPSSVPSKVQVLPGVGVSIVLKIDQPTGRQVQGIVQQVLTSGDHPRGIKVKLDDGRVGRVQAIVPKDDITDPSAGLRNLGRNGQPEDVLGSGDNQIQRRRREHFTDVRRDDQYDYESHSSSRDAPSLMDYVRTPQRKRGQLATRDAGANASEQEVAKSGSDLIACPVCGKFEGDESAVAFHVNSHFE